MSMARFVERDSEELQLLIEEKDSTNTKQNTKAAAKLLSEYCSVDMFYKFIVARDSGLRRSCDNVISWIQFSMSQNQPCNN